MAKRHNNYSQLLGTVENDITPLKEQRGISDTMDGLPMTGVPDLETIAQDCASMANQLNRHAHHLHGMSQMQPAFNEQVGDIPDLQAIQFEGDSSALPGGY